MNMLCFLYCIHLIIVNSGYSTIFCSPATLMCFVSGEFLSDITLLFTAIRWQNQKIFSPSFVIMELEWSRLDLLEMMPQEQFFPALLVAHISIWREKVVLTLYLTYRSSHRSDGWNGSERCVCGR